MHQKALSVMPSKDRERLIWQMRYDLLFQDSSFDRTYKKQYAEHSLYERDLL